ncbi:O-antigen polymerase [Acinetobacter sp. YH1901136]|uniref:O-antigen polymerase n=1 Tax=Acinetobacter sp. YH1901136 TaxID=2601200 RepID=UPI0015D26D22|nr:O-antigen polymerase [Acinetobacter sp. YH1901136]
MLTKKHMYSRGVSRSLCFFLLIFCSFFSINSFLINPTYIFGLLTLIFSFFFFNGKVDKLEFIFYVYFFISILLFFIAIYYFSIITNDEKILSSILYLYCILLGSQTIALGMLLSREKRVSIYRVVYSFLIIFMILELFFRVVFAGGHASSFYDYKQSLFFTDSNFSSFIVLFFLMFALFLKDKKIYNIGVAKFSILIFLLVMTFSRASIFAYFVGYLFVRSNIKYKTAIFFSFLIVYFYVFYRMVSNYIDGASYRDLDGSFNSKFYLISVAIDNYSKLPLVNKFFGIGLNNFPYYADGRFAHNIFITFIYEFGYLGSIGFILFIFYSYKKIGKDYTYLLIPMLVAGFSLFSAYMPFFFVLSACMYIEIKKNHGKTDMGAI